MILRRKTKSSASSGSSGDGPAMPPIELKFTAYPKDEAQGVLIACRQLPGYPVAMGVLAQAFGARADRILLDFSATATSVKFRVDGVWEANPPMDRPTGDAALVVLKKFFGMNPNDRRARQQGKLAMTVNKIDWLAECLSQGVSAGERVMITFEAKKPFLKTMEDLGMRDAMREQFRAVINGHDGLVVISAPAGHGLPTTWRVALDTADKFVRDWISVEDKRDPDPELINVTQHMIEEGQKPAARMELVLLKQPDVFVMPRLYDSDVVGILLDQISNNGKFAVTRIVANDAVDAVLQLLGSQRSHAKELLMKLNGVLNQHLVRRLCDTCKQPFTPSAQVMQRLGIPAGRVTKLYQPFILPPPDKRVDEKGQPIEPCPKCQGRGYIGRVAIFELLKVDDNFRKAVLKYAKQPDDLRKVAKQLGHMGFQEEGVLAVAMGLTSLQELQRVMTGK
jgi:type II secretory ATPase GspE/PulE/Tfp pilus assembly ATPase PilB-like protein